MLKRLAPNLDGFGKPRYLIPESEMVCIVEQCSHACTEGSVMDTGMASFVLCARSRWGTAYRKATGTGTAWNFKMQIATLVL